VKSAEPWNPKLLFADNPSISPDAHFYDTITPFSAKLCELCGTGHSVPFAHRPLVQRRRTGGTVPVLATFSGVSKTLVFDTGEYGANGAALPPLVLRCSSGRAAQGSTFRYLNHHYPSMNYAVEVPLL